MPISMKSAATTRRTLFGVLLGVILVPAYLFTAPLVMSLLPAAERTLSFKLPIEGAVYHWRFLDREAFLAGELTIRIINDDRDETLVVFRDGRIEEGWEPLDEERPGDGYYFGFATRKRYLTKSDDSLVITLNVPNDLAGRGPYQEGVLAKGTWRMTGTHSSMYGGRWNPLDAIVLRGDPPITFLECWKGVWPITVTKAEGWKGAKSGNRFGFLAKLGWDRGTNGDKCGSHIWQEESNLANR